MSESPLASAAAPQSGERFGGTFTSLKERDYAWFFAGNIAFFMGMQMQFVLRGYLAYDLTDSAASLGIIALSIALPMLFVAPVGGVVADRVNKRTLLIITQSIAGIASLITAALIISGVIEFWHLIATSLVTGFVFSFNMPARQSLVPSLVPKHKLANAVSLQMGGMNLTRIVAPSLGGLLIGPIGAGWVYVITCAMFGLAIASEFKMPKHGMTAVTEKKSFKADFLGGFQYILSHRTIGMLVLAALLMPLFAFPVNQILPVFADDVFDTGSAGLGLMLSMTGLGGLIGAVASANMERRTQKGLIMLVGGLILGIATLGFALSPTFLLALPCLAISGVGQMLFQATNNSSIQALVPAEVRGRVMSVLMMSFGLMPLGVLPVTAAADVWGADVAVTGLGVVMLLTLFAFFALSREVRTLRVEQAAHADLSPIQAAALVAQGKLSQAQADSILAGGSRLDEGLARDMRRAGGTANR